MTRANVLALAALGCLTALVLAGKLPAEALVTWLVGLMQARPEVPSA